MTEASHLLAFIACCVALSSCGQRESRKNADGSVTLTPEEYAASVQTSYLESILSAYEMRDWDSVSSEIEQNLEHITSRAITLAGSDDKETRSHGEETLRRLATARSKFESLEGTAGAGTPVEPTLPLHKAVEIAAEHLAEISPDGSLVLASVEFSHGGRDEPGRWYFELSRAGEVALGDERTYEGAVQVLMSGEVFSRKVVLPPKSR